MRIPNRYYICRDSSIEKLFRFCIYREACFSPAQGHAQDRTVRRGDPRDDAAARKRDGGRGAADRADVYKRQIIKHAIPNPFNLSYIYEKLFQNRLGRCGRACLAGRLCP